MVVMESEVHAIVGSNRIFGCVDSHSFRGIEGSVIIEFWITLIIIEEPHRLDLSYLNEQCFLGSVKAGILLHEAVKAFLH